MDQQVHQYDVTIKADGNTFIFSCPECGRTRRYNRETSELQLLAPGNGQHHTASVGMSVTSVENKDHLEPFENYMSSRGEE